MFKLSFSKYILIGVIKMKKVNVAIVGATGMVGRTFLKVLEERKFPINNLYLFSSATSFSLSL